MAFFLQGGPVNLQGSSGAGLQGSSPKLQMTFNPQPAVATFNLNQSGSGGVPIYRAPTGGGGSTGGGGGGGGSVTSRVASGPSAAQIAAQQAAAQQAAAVNSFNDTLGAIHSTNQDTINTNAGSYGTFIGDAFSGNGGFNAQQRNVNNEDTQNNLSKIQGMQDVRDMINNGIEGGSVMLDNEGSGSSSAPEALARAYGILGRQQASKVGSQFAQGQNQVQTDQANLDDTENNFQTHDMADKKNQMINTLVNDTMSKLSNLNYMATISNIPNRVNIMQEIAGVKANATASLSALDSQFSSSKAANPAYTPDQALAKATELHVAGTAPSKAFDYTTNEPTSIQNTGPAASPLPIYLGGNQGQNKDNGSIPALA